MALLLVGLPIVDILAVLYQRIKAKMNWFRATRNHIHHRLLDIGFDHYQAVLAIYSVQALLVGTAIALAFESELLIIGAYALICGTVFALLISAERLGWRVRNKQLSLAGRLVGSLREKSVFARGPLLFVQISVPLYLLVTGVTVGAGSVDSANSSDRMRSDRSARSDAVAEGLKNLSTLPAGVVWIDRHDCLLHLFGTRLQWDLWAAPST